MAGMDQPERNDFNRGKNAKSRELSAANPERAERKRVANRISSQKRENTESVSILYDHDTNKHYPQWFHELLGSATTEFSRRYGTEDAVRNSIIIGLYRQLVIRHVARLRESIEIEDVTYKGQVLPQILRHDFIDVRLRFFRNSHNQGQSIFEWNSMGITWETRKSAERARKGLKDSDFVEQVLEHLSHA